MGLLSTGVDFTRRSIQKSKQAFIGNAAENRRYATQRYFDYFGRWPNLNRPTRFTEKLLWLGLYYHNPRVPSLVDKWQARAFVAKLAGPQVLNECYGVWDRPEDIPFGQLPQQFALKVTAGCGWNILCNDRAKLNIPQTIEQLGRWQKTNFYYQCREWQYKQLRNRIIAERLMVDAEYPDRSPPDMKVFCFGGQPRVIGISTDRRGDVRHDFFDDKWKRVDYGVSKMSRCDIQPAKPDDLQQMLDVARKLSAGFPFVRVDLYRHESRVLFGEMTFSPSAGNMDLNAPGADETWGNWLTLPEKSGMPLWDRLTERLAA